MLARNVKVPVLGLGTWGVGGYSEINNSADKESVLAIKTAIRLGMTHIDTAEMYALSHSEELVGQAIREFNRKKLFITTKVSPQNLKYDDVISSAKASLMRLKTSYVDLYLIHFPNPDIPIEETMKAMDFLVKQGLVRFIGVSNFSVEQMKEAQKHSKNKIIANQVEYNLPVRNKGKYMENMESEVLSYCQKNNIMFIAWRPLALGLLATHGFNLLDELAEKYKRSRAQVALNWLISKKNVVTIVKTLNTEHLKENLGMIDLKLEKEDVDKLDNEFEIVKSKEEYNRLMESM